MEMLEAVKKALVDEKPSNFDDCLRWAVILFQDNYHNTIKQLLYNFPPDQVFWEVRESLRTNYNNNIMVCFFIENEHGSTILVWSKEMSTSNKIRCRKCKLKRYQCI